MFEAAAGAATASARPARLPMILGMFASFVDQSTSKMRDDLWRRLGISRPLPAMFHRGPRHD
jgi:hypothetical protein